MECARPASRYVEIPGSTLPASDHLDCGPFVAGIDLIVVLRLQSFDKSSSTIKWDLTASTSFEYAPLLSIHDQSASIRAWYHDPLRLPISFTAIGIQSWSLCFCLHNMILRHLFTTIVSCSDIALGLLSTSHGLDPDLLTGHTGMRKPSSQKSRTMRSDYLWVSVATIYSSEAWLLWFWSQDLILSYGLAKYLGYVMSPTSIEFVVFRMEPTLIKLS